MSATKRVHPHIGGDLLKGSDRDGGGRTKSGVNSQPEISNGMDPLAFLIRHRCGDWGDLDEHDRNENELSLQHGLLRKTLSTLVRN